MRAITARRPALLLVGALLVAPVSLAASGSARAPAAVPAKTALPPAAAAPATAALPGTTALPPTGRGGRADAAPVLGARPAAPGKPSVSLFGASAGELPGGGGTVRLLAFVSGVSSCRVSSSGPAVLDEQVPCASGRAATVVQIPPNLSVTPRELRFSFSATGVSATRTTVVHQAAELVAPLVVTDPASVEVQPGSVARFSARASGSPAPQASWEVLRPDSRAWQARPSSRAWQALGRFGPTLTVRASAADDGDDYRAVFTTSAGTATSAASTLVVVSPSLGHATEGTAGPSRSEAARAASGHRVLRPASAAAPTVTLQPSSTTARAGSTATFSAAASGTPAPTVQWYESPDQGSDWTAVTGATSNSYTTAALSAASDGDELKALFSNSAGSATSAVATLSVDCAPVINLQPTSAYGVLGGSVSLVAAAKCSPAPSVQWQVSSDQDSQWSAISGAHSATLTLSALSTSEAGNDYRAEFTNSLGSAYTTTAELIGVYALPSITSQPSGVTVAAGATVSLQVGASGSPKPTVQWYDSPGSGAAFAPIVGATSAVLTMTASAADTGYEYEAKVSNPAGSTTSDAATVVVEGAPYVESGPAAGVASTAWTAGQGTPFEVTARSAAEPTVTWEVSTDKGAQWSPVTDDEPSGNSDDTRTWASPVLTASYFPASFASSASGDYYRAELEDSWGSTYSAAAELTVYSPAGVSSLSRTTTVEAGKSLTLSVTPSGSDATVTWYDEAPGSTTPVSVDTADALSIAATLALDGYRYQAEASNPVSSAESGWTTLSVYQPPAVTTQPADVMLPASGGTASFTAAASGSPAPTVQWQVLAPGQSTWSNVSGATSDTYQRTADGAQDGEQYRAVFTNAYGTATSTVAVLEVTSAPVVVASPTDQTVLSGKDATFSAVATGWPTPSPQWQVSKDGGEHWSAISGATSSNLEVAVSTAENGNEYRVAYTNAAGSTSSDPATLLAGTVPAVTAQPTDAFAGVSDETTYSAAASGYPAPTLQWQVSDDGGAQWSALPGATSDTYRFEVAAGHSGDKYRAVFTNELGAATSSAPTLTITPDPVITEQPKAVRTAAGVQVQLSASAEHATSYAWEVSDDGGAQWITAASGSGASAGYSLTTTASDNGDEVMAVFTDSSGSTGTRPVRLSVWDPAMTTRTWAGYVAAARTSPVTYTRVSGDWTVPSVTCAARSGSITSSWIGIDGFDSSTVEQEGTSQTCEHGLEGAYSWYEMYGDKAVNRGRAVPISSTKYPTSPGDQMQASVSYSGGTFTLAIADLTRAWRFSTAIAYPDALRSSIEWIVERPTECGSSCGWAPLSPFSTYSFRDATGTSQDQANTAMASLANITSLEMSDTWDTGPRVVVSPPIDGGESFQVAFVSPS